MNCRTTFARLLMTSAIALTSFSIQEAWATKKLFENAEDEKQLKRKLPDNMNEDQMAQDSDLVFALQMEWDENPLFNMSPVKKPRYILKENDDATSDDENDIHSVIRKRITMAITTTM